MFKSSLNPFRVGFPSHLMKITNGGEAAVQRRAEAPVFLSRSFHLTPSAAESKSIRKSGLGNCLSILGLCSAAVFPGLSSSFSRSAYHHSAQLQRFFTNRYHKKVCPKCTRTNILPATRCYFCETPLTDLHIQSIGRDPLCELVLSRGAHHDQSAALKAKYVAIKEKKYAENDYNSLQKILKDFPQPLASSPCLPAAPATPAAAAAAAAAAERTAEGAAFSVWGGGYTELFRSFEFVVSTTPFPSGFIHLIAVPRASVYDIKQLRRSHVPLLQAMKTKLHAFADLLLDLKLQQIKDSALPSCVNSSLFDGEGKQKKEREQQDTSVAASINSNSPKIKQQILQRIIFGFNYPAEYRQLCLHAVAPPFINFYLFEFPYFYSFNKTIQDINNLGSVQPFSLAEGLGSVRSQGFRV